jgi:type IV pilus assembly protein PilB
MIEILKELINRNIIDRKKAAELQMETKASRKKVEELLLEKHLISEEELFLIKSKILNLPYVKLEPEEIEESVLETFPKETAQHYQIIPLKKIEGKIQVGTVWPEDFQVKEVLKFLEKQKKLSFELVLISPSNFKELIKKYEEVKRELVEVVETIKKEIGQKTPEISTAEAGRLTEAPPVVKAIDTILKYAIEGEASDIHLEPLEKETIVRFRILGRLAKTLTFPIQVHPALVARIKILSNLRLDETRIPQDGRFSFIFEGRKIDLRVSTFPTSSGEKVVLRILDPKKGLKKIEELGLRGKNYQVFQTAIEKPYGMILITGPTGSGKTTTLYAILQKLNKEDVNIVTLEDPVEYLIEGINQSQIRPEIGYSFATGLRHILRQDPNIIMVGEIRDRETAELAVQAALTGHLMLSTLHTNNAPSAVLRLVDLGIEPFLISSSLILVVSQRLVRVLCPKCKQRIKPSEKLREILMREVEQMPEEIKKEIKFEKDLEIFEPKGCKDCNFQGFSDRMGIFEVLEFDEEIKDFILSKPTEQEIFALARKKGMITLREDGILKILSGETTLEEILKET